MSGRVEWENLGDSLADGDWAAVELAATVRWPSLRERFQVWGDGSIWLIPAPTSAWRGPLLAIDCFGREVITSPGLEP